ncbi:MAG: hypothetical protein ACK4GL_03550 [Flavobacteriales bacterium]
MKKILFAVLFGLIMSNSVILHSQAYEKGQVTADFTTGFIGLYGYNNFAVRTIPLTFAAEYGFHEYVSAGVYASMFSQLFKIPGIPSYRISYVPFGFRGCIHLTDLINQNLNLSLSATEIDLYGGIHAGYVINSSRRLTSSGVLLVRERFYPIAGLFAGARYYFLPNVAGVFEFGATPNGLFNFGLTLKLK